jgi:uncharacterized membrane protein
VGPDGKTIEPESNVLLASMENVQYAVTVDVLHTVCHNLLQLLVAYLYHCHSILLYLNLNCLNFFQVFSAFGTVQKITIFDKLRGLQALIQYPGEILHFFYQ